MGLLQKKIGDNSFLKKFFLICSTVLFSVFSNLVFSGTPFDAQPLSIKPGTILQAENFDRDGQNVSYYDVDMANKGKVYRPNENVDIQTSIDNNSSFHVAWTADGEWLNYSVDIQEGVYQLSARVASAVSNPGDLTIQIHNGNAFTDLGTFPIESTGNWQVFETLTLNDIALPSGLHTLRLKVVGGDFNINYIAFETSTSEAVTIAKQDGDWDLATTWTNGIPNASKRAIIPPNIRVTLWDGQHHAKGVIVQGILNIGERVGAKPELKTDWVHVNSNGLFAIGNKNNPFNTSEFTLHLIGDDPLADWTIETAMGTMDIVNNNGFLMAAGGGSLQFYGENKLSFTRLSATAPAGDKAIYVRNLIQRNYDGRYSVESDGELNWEIGDEIVIASSSMDYTHQEIRIITEVTDLGNSNSRLVLDKPLEYRHYGQKETYGTGNNTRTIDLRAEVALLNRNVKIQGLTSQDTDEFFGDRKRFNAGLSQGVGGHIMVMGSAGLVVLDSVQLHGMGQTGRLGRYPMHWHIAGDRTGDMLRGVSITNSNNRGVTIHGTHNLHIEDVVLHDIHGHGFFMEDAVETGNTFIANIAFGIHKVGRSDALGDSVPDVNDPFIVDTHDHAGQSPMRFLNSAAFWMTNPDNTWRGNISAGSEGSGFWFLFPDFAIGTSAMDPQYADVKPDAVNLREFSFNSSHSSPVGFTVDRGSDIEVPVGTTLLPNWNGVEYNPPEEPQFANFTGYKHNVAIYHRGRVGNFVNNMFADNFTSTFVTFTQRITNALYIGHSRGNSDPKQIVTGHTFYDGANILDGTHFAGFSAPNAHMFRSAAIAARNTHFVMRNSSFENDGSANHMSFVNPDGGNFYEPLGKMAPSVLLDEDGSLTEHVGGGAGTTVIPNHPYYYDDNDRQPQGWNAWISDDRYSLMLMSNVNGSDTQFQVTTPDGDSASDSPGSGEFSGTNALVKMDSGEYSVNFPEGLNSVAGGFDVSYFIRTGPQDGSTMVKFSDIGNQFTVTNRTNVGNLNAVRNAIQTSFARLGNDIYVKFFATASSSEKVQFRPLN
ncbi:MAG: carbohydrate-binding protein [Pseudomonadota bacterium]